MLLRSPSCYLGLRTSFSKKCKGSINIQANQTWLVDMDEETRIAFVGVKLKSRKHIETWRHFHRKSKLLITDYLNKNYTKVTL